MATIDDGVNLPTQQFFDGQGRLRDVVNPKGDTLNIKYDAADRLAEVTDQRSLTTQYFYDGFGDLQTLISPDTGTTQYDYDKAGNRTRQLDARGIETTYIYDALNRLYIVDYPGGLSQRVVYNYDNGTSESITCNSCQGRLRRIREPDSKTYFTYDSLGRIDQRANRVALPGGSELLLTTDFDFNPAGRLEQIAYPNGQVVDYGFDAAGQVDTVTYEAPDPNDPQVTTTTNIANNIEYQPFGDMTQVFYGNSLGLYRVYDEDNRLRSQTVTGLQSLNYVYDDLNNIEFITDYVDSSRSESFSYDELNQLETAQGKYGDITYTYDEVGNRATRTIVRGALTITETYSYPPTNNRLDEISIDDGTTQRTREFDYDNAGNLTEEKRDGSIYMQPQYDHRNRMDSVTP